MEKKNTGLIVFVVILSLLAIGLGGFIIYDKGLSQKNIEESDSNANDNEEQTSNSYKVFAKNLKSQFSKYNSNGKNYQYIKNSIVPAGYAIYLNENGSLFVKYFDQELNAKYGEYKIADNVLSFYAINVGQDIGNILYFINEDGTVGSANTEYGINSNNQITIKNDIGYKNIVSIINGSFSDGLGSVKGPIFIDINGNIFSENLK